MNKKTKEAAQSLAIHCRYFAVEAEVAADYYDITGYLERLGNVPEPCGITEYVAGGVSDDLWEALWDEFDLDPGPWFWVDLLYLGA